MDNASTSINGTCHYCNMRKKISKLLSANTALNHPNGRVSRFKRVTSTKNSSPPLKDEAIFESNGRATQGEILDDLRDELLAVKRDYAAVLRENAVLKTRLKIASKEIKHKSEEMKNLLEQQSGSATSLQIQINSLKRKVLQYETSLNEKSNEINNLLADKKLADATETRKKLEKLEKECRKLKQELRDSIPMNEFFKERHHYTERLNRLTTENLELQKLMTHGNKAQDVNRIVEIIPNNSLNQLKPDGELINEMRRTSLARKREVEEYQNALSYFVRNKSIDDSRLPHLKSSRFRNSRMGIKQPSFRQSSSKTISSIHPTKLKSNAESPPQVNIESRDSLPSVRRTDKQEIKTPVESKETEKNAPIAIMDSRKLSLDSFFSDAEIHSNVKGYSINIFEDEDVTTSKNSNMMNNDEKKDIRAVVKATEAFLLRREMFNVRNEHHYRME
uniref:Lebercilin domain-containing protein n=1 Tax=Acrobeloides nanus TaxID=290746 RepID=A0A914CM44_9BILA